MLKLHAACRNHPTMKRIAVRSSSDPVSAGSAARHFSAHLSMAPDFDACMSSESAWRMAVRRATALTLIGVGLIVTPLWAAALGALAWSLVP
jgi:hypothetical protein